MGAETELGSPDEPQTSVMAVALLALVLQLAGVVVGPVVMLATGDLYVFAAGLLLGFASTALSMVPGLLALRTLNGIVGEQDTVSEASSGQPQGFDYSRAWKLSKLCFLFGVVAFVLAIVLELAFHNKILFFVSYIALSLAVILALKNLSELRQKLADPRLMRAAKVLSFWGAVYLLVAVVVLVGFAAFWVT